MEENVDRGMWSVVALLAAITLGGIALLVYPKLTDRFANEAEGSLDGQVISEKPAWEKDVDGKVPDWKVELNPGEYEEPDVPVVPDPEEPGEVVPDPEPEPTPIPEHEKFEWEERVNFLTDKGMMEMDELGHRGAYAHVRRAPEIAMRTDYTRNYIINSNYPWVNSNNNQKYPANITKESGFVRIQRKDLHLTPTVLSIYTNFQKDSGYSQISPDFWKEVGNNTPVYMSFEARSNIDLDFDMYLSYVTKSGENGYFNGHGRKSKITNSWQKYEFVLIPPTSGWDSIKIIRANPRKPDNTTAEDIKNLKLDLRHYQLTRKPGKWYPAFEDLSDSEKPIYYAFIEGGDNYLKLKYTGIRALARGQKAKMSATYRNDGTQDFQVHPNIHPIEGSVNIKAGQVKEWITVVEGTGETHVQFRFQSQEKEKAMIHTYFKNPRLVKEKRSNDFDELLAQKNIYEVKDNKNIADNLKYYPSQAITYKDVWGNQWTDYPKEYGWHLVDSNNLQSNKVSQAIKLNGRKKMTLELTKPLNNGAAYSGYGKIIGLDSSMHYKKELQDRIDNFTPYKITYDVSGLDYVLLQLPYGDSKGAWKLTFE